MRRSAACVQTRAFWSSCDSGQSSVGSGDEAAVSEIYFAQVREDSRIERRLQASYEARRVLTIGSGGCTAFSLLDDELESLVVVDANPAQCALIELKKAALIALEREDYLAFIGERPAVNRLGTYRELEGALTDGPGPIGGTTRHASRRGSTHAA